MAKKLYDIAVANGSYTDVEGNKKNRYANIGVVMQSDDGNVFAILERHANLAGFPHDPAKGNSVIASLFKPEGNAPKQRQSSDSLNEMTDDIPF